jgi:predicted phosphoribosyltransferase
MFKDRNDAAAQLANRLLAYKGKNPLVLAIPRGAVPMALHIADALQGQMDVVLVRKLRAPHQPELAIGAVDESGWTTIADYAPTYGATESYLATEKQAQMHTIRQRRAQYTPIRPHINPAGRIVIVVDDGMATGASMLAALHSVRTAKPSRLVCAVPVSPPDTLAKVRALADEVVCLQTPPNFQAVGQFYQHFPQIEDADIAAMFAQRPDRET